MDMSYVDTMGEGNFVLKNTNVKKLSNHELNIFNKFNKIIKETKEKIDRHVDNIDVT